MSLSLTIPHSCLGKIIKISIKMFGKLTHRFGARCLQLLPAETAHHLAMAILARNLVPRLEVPFNPMLQQALWGLSFPHPVGLAAGFDKNGKGVASWHRYGFAFAEMGSVTPQPQEGNPRPRLFRLKTDRAIINRMGFNNEGLAALLKRLPSQRRIVTGVNFGKNKTSLDAVQDYEIGLRRLGPYVDYFVVNISSPNTPGLRSLQAVDSLAPLIARLKSARDEVAPGLPVLIKIAPDLSDEESDAMIALLKREPVDGLIISNTTLSRPASLQDAHRDEAGGLSGAPLYGPSTALLSRFYRKTGGTIPLIGVGGIMTPEDAYGKIRAGASLLQLYSGLVYEGFNLTLRILEALPGFLARDGFSHIGEAIGADHVHNRRGSPL